MQAIHPLNEAALDLLDLLKFYIKWKEIVVIQYLPSALYDHLPIFYDDNICFSDFSLSFSSL